MTNRYRGEVSLTLGDRSYPLRLSLQALAEIEAAFGAEDLQALGARLAQGRFAARDLVVLLGASLRGGGTRLDDTAVAALVGAGDLALAIDALGELFALTFGAAPDNHAGERAPAHPPMPQPR